MLGSIFECFVEKSPIAVMAGATIERALGADQIDQLFEETSERQYTRELLFSTVFDLMSQVVCGSQPTIHAAFQASVDEISVSVTSIYNKLNGIETQISASLVAHSAEALGPVIETMNGSLAPLLPGYRVKILDGNCLEATEHRIKELRQTAAGPLPGKSLVVLDPMLKLAVAVVPCEDGHSQERALIDEILPLVHAGECWIEDRNFCTIKFLDGVAERDACFIVRQHQNLPCEPILPMRRMGRIDRGTVYEQSVRMKNEEGRERRLRRIRILLDEPTRDGEQEIFLLTNLPKKV